MCVTNEIQCSTNCCNTNNINRIKRCTDICANPIGIECRTRKTHIPWNETGEIFDVPCTPTGGIVCVNRFQKDKQCQNYEIRVLCPPDHDECLEGTDKCHEYAECVNSHGGYFCKCKDGYIGDGFHCYEGAKCKGHGDPHYMSFDHRKFNFQGLCTYRMAEPCHDVGGIPDFQVTSKSKFLLYRKRGNAPVSTVRNIRVKVYGFDVLFGEHHIVSLDGEDITVPKRFDPASVKWPGSYLEIRPFMNGVELITDFGLRVMHDGQRRFEIQVPSTLKSHMCGLCGNYDGNPTNDFRKLDGTQVGRTEANAFGDSWGIKDKDSRCKIETPAPVSCNQEAIMKAIERCSLITDVDGPFKDCLANSEMAEMAQQYQDSCAYDLCMMVDDDSLLCPTFEAFAYECEVKNFVVEWRTPERCPPDCPVNMHYEASASSCKPSCYDLEGPLHCPDPPAGGCQCDAGYVLSGTDCILVSDCGCTVNNTNYYKLGESWLDKFCLAKLTCIGPGEIESDNTVQCHEHGECYVHADGSSQCRCQQGFEGTGKDCMDQDECSLGDHQCAEVARCVNQKGGYDCICEAGYTGDGFTCTDADECEEMTDQCSDRADCENTVGSYICVCHEGYVGDGRVCAEEKPLVPEKPLECSVFQKELCVECADCVLLPDGSSGCVCPAEALGDGFKGEGYTGCRVPTCPPGFIKHEDGCYSFNESPKTFSEARRHCQSDGGDLASLISGADIEFVAEEMELLGLTNLLWIGYTDHRMDGIFAWVDDAASDFTNWKEGEPKEENSNMRDCVALGMSSDYKFSTHHCEEQAGFICRKPLQLTACPRGWYMFEGECYYRFQMELRFIEAYLSCIVNAADLTSILSTEEEMFINEVLMTGITGPLKMWIGAAQGFPRASVDFFTWSDGEQLNYTQWAEGEPQDPSTPKCVYMNEKMEWNAVMCDSKYQYICKRNQQVKERCPEGSIRIGKNCYKVFDERKQQPDGKEDCRKMGGGLVSIHSKLQQYIIGRYLKSQALDLNPWIGFVEKGVDGVFNWTDRSKVDYFNWEEKQPDDKVDHNNCVAMIRSHDYKWNDLSCNEKLPFLCQYRNTPCVDEDACHENAQCSFGQCRCRKGFMGDGKDVCDDIDECDEGDPCPEGAVCVNKDGGYECDCEPGFIRSGDECLSLTKCATDADCNTLGECNEGNCQCQEGYTGDGKQTCEDVNECEEGTFECNPNADCKNKKGGYDCICKDGYMGDGLACNEYPRNCEEVRLQNPELTSGPYKIDPDGAGGLRPFTVMCIMRPGIGITVIPSNSQKPKPVKSAEAEKRPVKYTKSDEQVEAVIEVSEFCYQNVLYKCDNGAKLQGVGSWTNKDNTDTPFDKCYCGMLGTCATPGSKCNCDGSPMGEQIDDMKVIDKTKLPVKSFNVGGVKPGQKASTSVGPLMCGPKQFDIPRDCDDALRNYGQKRNGPMLIDVDGADGDDSGNLKPFVADCDMTSYPSTGVTIIPNKLPKEKKPDQPGEIPVEYPADPETIEKLTEISKFCLQEMSYTCTNSGLLGAQSFWSNLNKTQQKYWAGGLGMENMCGCGVTKSCEDAKVKCNCDISDGKERKDFGLIINKADLPVGSVTLKAVGGDKKGSLSVGPLMCGQNQFGIEPTCQQYREKGYKDDYTYLIDPDGHPRRADEPAVTTTEIENERPNVAPFPVICEMIDDKPVGITTVGHNTEKPTKVDDAKKPGSYEKPVKYIEATPEQLTALIDHSSYCTQEMAYKCKQAMIHNVDDPNNPISYWIGRNGKKNQYFAGVQGSMCQCGIEGNCEGKDVVCNCDANLDKEVVDKGFLANKDDLPVLKLAFGDTGDDDKDFGEHTLGKLRCFEVFETCYHMQEFYRKRPHNDLPPNGKYMIDPDGPLKQDPFEVYCHFPKTIVDIEAGNYFALPDEPESRGPGAQCYKPHYKNANKEQLEALTEISGFCRQYAKYTCQHASFTVNAHWKSSSGKRQKGWAGSAGGDKCACGEVGKCEGGGACNCDSSDKERRQDHGLFINKKLLPVSEICFGVDDKEVGEGEMRFAEYYLGSLECSNVQFGIPKDCQALRNSKTPAEPIESEPWLIDPDQLGALKPFPVFCEMYKEPPIGVTVVEPVPDKPEEIPKDGKDLPLDYKSSTLDQLKALTEISVYCTQEMSYKCKDAALKLGDAFGAYSRGGKLLTYWAGNSGGKDGCKGGKCQCGKVDGKEYTDGGSLLDKKVLPVSRVNIAASEKGTRKLIVEDLRCFALFKTCHEIKMAAQDNNPNWDGRYGIDPDGAGDVKPFSVDCDFTTNPEIGITQVPSDVEEEIPVGEKPLNKKITYGKVIPVQANQLAKVSEFCLQGMKYKCKNAALMGAGGAFLDYNGTASSKFAGADSSEKDGCACVVLGTCPANNTCRCNLEGPMEAEEGDFVTNRDMLPVTGVKSDGVKTGGEASFKVGDLRCGPKPFDLPEDCQQALDWGYKTGEALIWPGRKVQPFLVFCDMDTYPGKGVTIVPTAVTEEPVVGVTKIPVKYDGASEEQIKALVDESSKCLLPMKYECTATMFSNAFSMVTPEKKDVSFFAAGRSSQMCNCGDQKRCGGDDGRKKMEVRKCNCDIGDTKWRKDAGIFGNQGEMPVTTINFKSQGGVTAKGKLTLGNLYCADKPIDLDECRLGFHDCHGKAKCINRRGYYQCVCEERFRGRGRRDVWANGRECYDDDECALGLCPDNSKCMDLPGTFNCTCNEGFMEDDKGNCVDINECTKGTHKCDEKAECSNTEGSYKCTCKLGAVGDGFKCEVSGTCHMAGPRVRTFDGKRIDMGSACLYTLARDSCSDVANLGKPAFEVLGQFEFKKKDSKGKVFSTVKDVFVKVGGVTIGLMQGGFVTENGVIANLPFKTGDVSVFKTGKFVKLVSVKLGLKVIFVKGSLVKVKVHERHQGKLCGVCGNYNDKQDDDLIMGALCEKPGKQTQNVNSLTSSWIVDDKDNKQCEVLCDIAPPESCSVDSYQDITESLCDQKIKEGLLEEYEKLKECVELMNTTGVDFVAQYLELCQVSLCASVPEVTATLCQIADNMAIECLDEVAVKVDISYWRMENGCVDRCGKNMVYKSCGTACPETCATPLDKQICTKQCVQGCFCAPGFVLDNDNCVKKKDCGCVMDEKYYSNGERIIKKDCTEVCECQRNGKMDCKAVKCDSNAACAIRDYVNGCYCNEGFAGDGEHCKDVNECTKDPCDVNAQCENTEGSFKCKCNEGFTGNGTSCDNVNECLEGKDNCDENAECHDTVGSFKCVCKMGYTMNKDKVCEDVNECTGRHDCEKKSTKCENTPGSFECHCLPGFMPVDRRECQDIDECESKKHECDKNAYCSNLIGDYDCTCNLGYEGDGRTCQDINECEKYGQPCSKNQVCNNTEGSFECNCKKGFKMVDKVCQDINECEDEKLHDCKADNSECKNTIGSFECGCASGYKGDGKTKCEDINDCELPGPPVCGTNSNCTNTAGYGNSFTCECKKGFASPAEDNRNCVDKNECRDGSHDCDEHAVCTNIEGSFTCECQRGYEGDGKTCKDINECEVTKDICGPNSNCTNKPATYECHCLKGYEMVGGFCQNINECARDELNDCDEKAHCSDLEATFQCQCFAGYSGSGKEGDCAPINECELKQDTCSERQNCKDLDPGFNCECKDGYEPFGSDCKDIDECDNEDDDCDRNADCENTEPWFKCKCVPGYTGNGKNCTDINECDKTCKGEGQKCTNKPGSYSCECIEGYEPMPDGTCKDIDECSAKPSKCSENMECKNTPGSYECSCVEGYEMADGNKQKCEDENECERDVSPCAPDEICENKVGGYSCKCHLGFEMVDGACTDINECANPMTCHGNAICSNTEGSFTCTCKKGFSGNGTECNDINECREGTAECSPNGVCKNLQGTYECNTCKPGYTGDGKTCEDRDECLENNGGCDQDAKCNNEDGGFNCTCLEGFSGDGRTCNDVNECEENLFDCPPYSDCKNSPGGFECICSTGYYKEFEQCYDCDECVAEISACGQDALCNNLQGSYECYCDEFYEMHTDGRTCLAPDDCTYDEDRCGPYQICVKQAEGAKCQCDNGFEMSFEGCIDINECMQQSRLCAPGKECVNTIGSFECICVDGYLMDDKGKCIDINECENGTHLCEESAKCKNTDGGFECTCEDGYELYQEVMGTFSCIDILECTEGTDDCDVHADCVDIPGSYNCTCRQGFTGDGKTCTDINECAGPNGCSEYALCIDGIGTYSCECVEGYVGNGFICNDIDECAVGDDNCAENSECVNTEGGFFCQCMEGYSGHCDACEDVDECATGLADCDDKAKCFNLEGSYSCDCPPGFQMVLNFCQDMNECALGIHDCGLNADCKNTNGSYECVCHLGYAKNEDQICEDINECSTNGQVCDENAGCGNTDGSYICRCNAGWQGDGETCEEIHPSNCGGQVCHSTATCKNNVCVCPPGARGNPIFGTDGCTDIDECSEGTNDCDPNADCKNIAGSYTCFCKNGFVGDGITCEDSRPQGCDSPTACGEHAECIDEGEGQYYCECGEGFDSVNDYDCVDINECDDFMTCEVDQLCYNTPGSYKCICEEGFYYDEDSDYCTDIDECELGTHDCDERSDGSGNGICINTEPSYRCECKEGFEGDGRRCVEKSDCSKKCGTGQFCAKAGSEAEEKCVCQSGYEPKDDSSCVAIDRCPDLCDKNANCTYDPALGSECTCNEGYRGNGRHCTNINECATGDAECSEEATCVDTIGSYKCNCPPGYSGDGFICEYATPSDDNCGCGKHGVCADPVQWTCDCDEGFELVSGKQEDRCADINECSHSGACHSLAECKNGMGSYNCTCIPGTDGDGFNFCNVDECKSNPCSPDAVCKNSPGGHTCNCNEGYTGDGYTCLEEGSPCTTDNGGCGNKAVCTTDATGVGVVCKCMAGFEGDGSGCTDTNECNTGTHTCAKEAACRNSEGGYTCECNTGYFGDGRICENIDECAEGIAGCSEFATCRDMEGGHECKCMPGYVGNGKKCGRDSGCKSGELCDEHAECLLLDNTYQCACNEGYRGDGRICTNVDAGTCEPVDGEMACDCSPGYEAIAGRCVDINECADSKLNNCEEHAECRDIDGAYECICEDGEMAEHGICLGHEHDIDECADPSMHNCHQAATCHNTPHGYYCKCAKGFEGDGTVCNDIDECEMGTDDCGLNTKCDNYFGTYSCSCLSGFEPDGKGGKDCVDVNECAEGNTNDCSVNANCDNNEGSYTCECADGYEGNGRLCLKVNPCDDPTICHNRAVCKNEGDIAVCICRPGYSGDGKQCERVNACETGTHNCHPNAKCHNEEEGFTCICKEGFFGDGINSCDDINECDPSTPNGGGHKCDPSNSDCANNDGGYNCVCKTGFARNKDNEYQCDAYNICEKNEDNCSDDAKCESLTGGFICTCKDGFQGNGTNCKDIDECKAEIYSCPSLTVCVNNGGGYKCECKEGYKQEGETCVDIDECATKTAHCGDKSDCINRKGSYVCVCVEGYKATPSGCVDADECGSGTDDCHEHSTCENTVGSFTCTCNEGYKKEGDLCVAIDKCADGAVKCGDNAICEPSGEKPHCECRDGYEGNPDTGCTDINECEGSNICSPKAECKNLPGTYSCKCKAGYRGNGKACEDIDDCFEGKDDCDDNADCENTPGNFICACKSGYQGNGKTCNQVNECETNPNSCSQNEKCKDTPGSYLCLCVEGYRKNSAGFCQDIDECAEGLATCHKYAAQCIDKDGGYDCKCKNGFEGDGRNCKDINECEKNTSGCDKHATCTNIEGGSTCSCKAGFDGNGYTCIDIDECFKGEPCGNSATCANTIGSFTCTCLRGFRTLADGSCEDINECVETPTVCPEKALCSNSRGHYQCVCPTGYESIKDGKECRKINPCLVNNCSPNADCLEEDLTFSCKCRDGYHGDGVHCEDDDECEEAKKAGTDVCHGDKCVNTRGGYDCICHDGFELMGGICKNIDECSLPETYNNAARCEDSEVCIDTSGSYRCECKAGYERESGGDVDDHDHEHNHCENINECADANRCHPNAICSDTVGSYACKCKPGYSGNGLTCVDIDECRENERICGDPFYSKCRNLGGSYACICGDGYEERDGTCQDIDECNHRVADCGSLGHCLNTMGGFVCECPEGYKFVNNDCRNIDECAFGIANCDINAECEDTEGKYKCTCRPGFSGNGLTCSQTCGESTCPHGMSCSVKDGKPTCQCKCHGNRCKRHGKVCGTNGVTYDSEKELVIAACSLGPEIQLDYRGSCKKTCDEMRCPRHKDCTLNKAGKPNCRCRACTKEEEDSGEVCTDKYREFYSICHFIQYQCNEDPDDDQVITTLGKCPDRVDCVVSDWGPWQPCSVTCGNGVIKRTREIIQDKIGEGEGCPVLEHSGNCYETPCPKTPCASKKCANPGEVCVMRGQEPVCECPDCKGLGEDLVCGLYANGTRTVRNKCTLQRDSCIMNQTVYLLYPNKCGVEIPNQPLDCTVMPHFGHVRNKLGCTTKQRQPINKCAGGCGEVTGQCCSPSAFYKAHKELRCSDGSVKFEEIPIIKECKCVPAEQMKETEDGIEVEGGFKSIY